MDIVRYIDRTARAVRVGVRQDESVTPLGVSDLAELLSYSASEIRTMLESAASDGQPVAELILLPPIDGKTEVWAAGVTYERSRSAREEESSVARVYEMVYEADRPELFFKSVAWRVVTDNEPVAIRNDSELNVPEAELALVINAHGEIVGYTVCNDMSSRTIEGENPLYLPQAKIYAGSCALATGIRPAWEVADPGNLDIRLSVMRDGDIAWQGTTNTSAMRRTPSELASWLFAEESFPAGAILSTGTGLVPEMDFSLHLDDIVRIEIDEVGTLTNTVLTGKDSFSWLSASVSDLAAEGTARNRQGT
jgi:2-dehydro-3-deoxy-D-arabinonate dehydratase